MDGADGSWSKFKPVLFQQGKEAVIRILNVVLNFN